MTRLRPGSAVAGGRVARVVSASGDIWPATALTMRPMSRVSYAIHAKPAMIRRATASRKIADVSG